MSENCAICGCELHRTRDTYARATIEGRSHATKHHFVAERFFGRSSNRRGTRTEGIFISWSYCSVPRCDYTWVETPARRRSRASRGTRREGRFLKQRILLWRTKRRRVNAAIPCLTAAALSATLGLGIRRSFVTVRLPPPHRAHRQRCRPVRPVPLGRRGALGSDLHLAGPANGVGAD